MFERKSRTTVLFLIWLSLSLPSALVQGQSIQILSAEGHVLPTVMVTRKRLSSEDTVKDSDGYPISGMTHQSHAELSYFSDASGRVEFEVSADELSLFSYRLRKPGYQDLVVAGGSLSPVLTLQKEIDPLALAEAKPANVWLSQLDFGGDEVLRKQFQINCGFCHQQGTAFMRAERSPEQWVSIIERMNGYGSRLADEDLHPLAEILSKGYKKLQQQALSLPAAKAWSEGLSSVKMTDLPIGDSFSQMHDFILHPNGKVYVGDNLQDRIYEVDPDTGEYSVYTVPREADMALGGILGNRFKTYPKINNYMGVHSFAISPRDGHIFITPSMQQALLEFDPVSKKFTIHKMTEGYYPHTIRTDDQDRVWFTLAVSSQVGMFDRNTKEFQIFDLPARSIKEWAILKILPLIFALDPDTRPMPSVDRQSTGAPMPYGIDVDPSGNVWVSRLYGNDIGRIDALSGEVTMIKTPFNGPRRLRSDAQGNIWIVAFQDSKIARYEPKENRFTQFDLPVLNELPYSLNVDKDRGKVWVNGNMSDSLMRFDIATESWDVFPLARKRSFTRDIEIDEDGSVFTSNSHFPSWQIEDGQPTLIRLQLNENL
jgi:streptogramin lyase